MSEKWRQDLIKDIRFNDARDDVDLYGKNNSNSGGYRQ
jgi:hypothetical protein